MKLEECLCYLKGNYIVLVIEPRTKLYIPFKPNEYSNSLKAKNYGEITVKLNNNETVDIFIPFIYEVKENTIKSVIGIDINERSVDLLIIDNKQGIFKSFDTSVLSTTHYTYSLKRKNIAKKIDNNLKYQLTKRKKLLCKYGTRERNKTKNFIHNLAKKITEIVKERDSIVVMENLTNIRQSVSRQKNLSSWRKKKPKNIRRRLNRWNFKQLQTYINYKVNSTGNLVEYINPRNTSIKCLKCGTVTKCNSQIFVCKHCGFKINRHLQASFNITEVFLKNEDVASSDPAERHHMKLMVGEFCKFKESIIGDANQYYRTIQNYPVLST